MIVIFDRASGAPVRFAEDGAPVTPGADEATLPLDESAHPDLAAAVAADIYHETGHFRVVNRGGAPSLTGDA